MPIHCQYVHSTYSSRFYCLRADIHVHVKYKLIILARMYNTQGGAQKLRGRGKRPLPWTKLCYMFIPAVWRLGPLYWLHDGPRRSPQSVSRCTEITRQDLWRQYGHHVPIIWKIQAAQQVNPNLPMKSQQYNLKDLIYMYNNYYMKEIIYMYNNYYNILYEGDNLQRYSP